MKLLAFSGKKQSGKDSAARFLDYNSGRLFGHAHRNFSWGPWSLVGPVITQTYYFGKPMKDFCEHYLGVPHELLWGTDAQKNQLTGVRWEGLPHYDRFLQEAAEHNRVLIVQNERHVISAQTVLEQWRHAPTGEMTARQLLQQVGEEMFLGMNPKIWTNKFKTEIAHDIDTVELGLVADPRKPEQIDTVHELGGRAIHLTRDPYNGQDRHISETALDQCNYDWAHFDAVIDNRNLTVVETNRKVYETLVSWGWVHELPNADNVLTWDPKE